MRPPNPDQERAIARLKKILQKNPATTAAAAAARVGLKERHCAHLMKIAKIQLGQRLTPLRIKVATPADSVCRKEVAEQYYRRLMEIHLECTRRQLSFHQVMMQAIDLWRKKAGIGPPPDSV